MACRTPILAAVVAGLTLAASNSAYADGHFGSAKGGSSAPFATTSIAVFSGIDVVEDATTTYTGFVAALNRDLSKDGFLVRGVGVFVSYEYGTVDGASNPITIDGDAPIIDLMVGYQFIRPGIRSAIYIGGEYQNHDLTPDDPANRVRGDEFGFKVAAEIETAATSQLYASLLGSYSTAFDTYWARGRLGWNFGRFIVGPEGGVSGNEGYDAQRVGGFVKFPVALGTRNFDVSVAAGHQFLSNDSTSSSGGGEGVYVSAGFSTSF
jgi:hypothetical protein